MPRQPCKLERMQAIQDIIGLLTTKIALLRYYSNPGLQNSYSASHQPFFHAILRGQLDSLVKKKAASLAGQEPTEARQASSCRGLLLAAMTLKVFFSFLWGKTSQSVNFNGPSSVTVSHNPEENAQPRTYSRIPSGGARVNLGSLGQDGLVNIRLGCRNRGGRGVLELIAEFYQLVLQ